MSSRILFCGKIFPKISIDYPPKYYLIQNYCNTTINLNFFLNLYFISDSWTVRRIWIWIRKIKKKKRKKEDSSFTCKFLKWWEAQSDFKKRQSAHFLGGWVIDVLILFIFIISFSLVMPIPTSDPLFICGYHSHPIKIPSSRFFLTLIANQFHPCFFHNEEEWKIGKNNIWYIYIYGDQR